MVRLLLDAGADPSIIVGGQTAMDIAEAFDQTDILNLLTNRRSVPPNV